MDRKDSLVGSVGIWRYPVGAVHSLDRENWSAGELTRPEDHVGADEGELVSATQILTSDSVLVLGGME